MLFFVTDLLMSLALFAALLVLILVLLEKFKQLRLPFPGWETLGQRVGRLLDTTTQTPNTAITVMMLKEHVSRGA